MSIKIAVDNNFFDTFHSLGDVEKRNILDAIKSKRISFYPTLQLSAELLGMYNTKRMNLLREYSRYFLEMMGYKFFNDWNRIFRIELGVLAEENIFLDSSYVKNCKVLFERIANSYEGKEEILNICEKIKKDKEKRYKQFKDNQEYHFKLLREKNVRVPMMSFGDFYAMNFAVDIRKNTIKDVFARANIPLDDKKVARIVDNQEKYPYYYVSSRVFMALFYRHIVLKRKVSMGDSYDQYQLIYLTNLDYLVSADRGLMEIAKDVFGSSKKVITCKQLIVDIL